MTQQTEEDTIHTHVADKVVVHKVGRHDIAYMSPDKATWSDAQLALHEACQAAYITFAQLENAWYLTGKSDHAIGDASLAAYAAWQIVERIASPYFPDL